MPTKTFFNLKTEKKERIIHAAKSEFSRVPFQEASISRIIADAGIPRGSFYQYFTDKADLYSYYFGLIFEDLHFHLIDVINDNDGDLFKACRIYFSHYIDEIVDGPNKAFFKNFFLNMNLIHAENAQHHGPQVQFHGSQNLRKIRSEIIDVTDDSKLNVANKHDIGMLFRMIVMVFFHSVARFFISSDGETTETVNQTKEVFNRNLDWLEFGARKNKGDKNV